MLSIGRPSHASRSFSYSWALRIRGSRPSPFGGSVFATGGCLAASPGVSLALRVLSSGGRLANLPGHLDQLRYEVLQHATDRVLVLVGGGFKCRVHALGLAQTTISAMRLDPDSPNYRRPDEWRPKLAALAKERGGELARLGEELEGENSGACDTAP